MYMCAKWFDGDITDLLSPDSWLLHVHMRIHAIFCCYSVAVREWFLVLEWLNHQIEGRFQICQRFSSSKLVLKDVKSCIVALNYWENVGSSVPLICPSEYCMFVPTHIHTRHTNTYTPTNFCFCLSAFPDPRKNIMCAHTCGSPSFWCILPFS